MRNMTEHEIQNAIRVYISQQRLGVIFRANVGSAWAGMVVNKTRDTVTLKNYRPFSTGLPNGFPDLFGFRTVTITPDMVGQTIAVFCGLEIKTARGRVRDDQVKMLGFLQQSGCRAGIARSTEDAKKILEGKEVNKT